MVMRVLVACALLLLVCAWVASSTAQNDDNADDVLRQFRDDALTRLVGEDAAEVLRRQFRVHERAQDQRSWYTDKVIYGRVCSQVIAGGKDPCSPNGHCDDSEGYVRCECTRGTGGARCQFRNVCSYNPCPNRKDMCIPTSNPIHKSGRLCYGKSYYRVLGEQEDQQWDKAGKGGDENDLK